jgi:hypothetical protein
MKAKLKKINQKNEIESKKKKKTSTKGQRKKNENFKK